MAQGFFKHIPNIVYDFKSDGNFIEAKDMFRKVSVWSYLQEGVTGYSYYRIVEGERPDVVASKLYNDATLYWTFFLVNENLQDFGDWPKSGALFNRFMGRKYSGTCLLASSSTDIVSYNHTTNVSSKFTLGEKVSQSSLIYGFVTDVNPTHNRITLNSVEGTFTSGGTATGDDSTKSFTISSIQNEEDAVHHYLDSNDQKTTVESYTSDLTNTSDATGTAYNYSTANNTLVTNFEYERDLNEDRHLIRYIRPNYISRIVKEFHELVRY
jgi:hypothetical protein